jgi:hypothetical protein
MNYFEYFLSNFKVKILQNWFPTILKTFETTYLRMFCERIMNRKIGPRQPPNLACVILIYGWIPMTNKNTEHSQKLLEQQNNALIGSRRYYDFS